MDAYTRKFVSSSDIFQGFELELDIRQYENIEEIINSFHKELLSVLKKYNLENLYQKCYSSKMHIHTHTFEEILLNKEGSIYICDC